MPGLHADENGSIDFSMNRYPSYPTTHPHWIDADDEPETQRSGISFKGAFGIVLVLHVAVIGAICAYTMAKPKRQAAPVVKEAAAASVGPKSDALARKQWPQPEAQPKVVATPAPVEKQVKHDLDQQVESVKAPAAIAKTKDIPQKPESSGVPAVPKQKAPVIAEVKETPRSKAVSTDNDALKKAFLAARNDHTEIVETRQAIPVSSSVEAVPATNVEIRRATLPASSAPSAIAGTQQGYVANAPVERPASYTLSPGENLYMVSRKLQVSYNDLMAANGLTDPRKLHVGQTLKVPGAGSL